MLRFPTKPPDAILRRFYRYGDRGQDDGAMQVTKRGALLIPDLSHQIEIGDALDETVSEDVRGHPQRSIRVLRQDMRLDRGVDRPLVDERAAGVVDKCQLPRVVWI